MRSDEPQKTAKGITEKVAKNVAILALAITALIALNMANNDLETQAKPLIDEKGKGGYFVLAEYLKASGYKVSSDFSPTPQLVPGKLYIEARLEDSSYRKPNYMSEEEAAAAEEAAESNETVVGTSVLYIVVPQNFNDTVEGGDYKVTEAEGLHETDRFKVSIASNETSFDETITGPAWTPILNRFETEESKPIAAAKVDGGIKGVYLAGTSLLNQQIGFKDHAKSFLYVVELLAGEDKEIVFLQNKLLGDAQPGLIASIGPWASTALYQLGFLVLLILYSLNKLFGLPIATSPYQRGSADSLFAIGKLYQITGNFAWARDQLALKANNRLSKIETSGRKKHADLTEPMRSKVKLLQEQRTPMKDSIHEWDQLFNQIKNIEDQIHTQKTYNEER